MNVNFEFDFGFSIVWPEESFKGHKLLKMCVLCIKIWYCLIFLFFRNFKTDELICFNCLFIDMKAYTTGKIVYIKRGWQKQTTMESNYIYFMLINDFLEVFVLIINTYNI